MAPARALQHATDPTHYTVVGPLFEMLLAAIGLVVHDLFDAAEWLAVISMTVALGLWGSLAMRRLGAAAGLLTVFFLASNAQFFRYGWSVTTDAPALAFQAASLWALFGVGVRANENGTTSHAPSERRILAAGLLAAAAFLTRYSSIALLPAGLAAVAFGWTGAPREARFRQSLIFVGAFLLPVVPWVTWSVTHGGSLQSKLHHNIAYEVFARPKGIVWDYYARDLEPQFPTLWSVISRDPVAVASRMAFNVFDHLRLDALLLAGIPLALAAAAGLWFAWRDRPLAALRPLLLAAFLLFLTLVPTFHSSVTARAAAVGDVRRVWTVPPRKAPPFAGYGGSCLLLPAVFCPRSYTRAFPRRARSINCRSRCSKPRAK
jgi:4-amino-4-deoxy-L-arabinose transferase-like glycosyltransferase